MKKQLTQEQKAIIEAKARALVASRTTLELIADFEESEKQPISETLPLVRGWLMDELENRDPEALAEWLDSNEASPRRFFIGDEDSTYIQEFDTFTDADPGL